MSIFYWLLDCCESSVITVRKISTNTILLYACIKAVRWKFLMENVNVVKEHTIFYWLLDWCIQCNYCQKDIDVIDKMLHLASILVILRMGNL